jgi:hypothetical protein
MDIPQLVIWIIAIGTAMVIALRIGKRKNSHRDTKD